MTHLERLAGGRSKRLLAASAALAFCGLVVALAATSRGPREPAVGIPRLAPEAPAVRPAELPATAEARIATPRPPAPARADDDELAVASAPPEDPSAWSEKEHLEHFRALAHRGGDLSELAGAVLAGDGPDREKVALLRALREADPGEAQRWCAWVLRELPDESDSPGAASVPAFLVRTLSEEAARDPVARTILGEATWGPDHRMAPALRRRAAAAVAAHATGDELSRLAGYLAGETDELVRAGVLAALHRHADPDAVARHFGPLPTDPDDDSSEQDG